MAAGVVRPQHDEHCERQFVCDSGLNGKSVGDDIELNGETDDEDIEDGETGFVGERAQARDLRDAGQRTASEHTEHMTTPQPHRSWCKFSVMRRGVNSPHRRSDARDDLEKVPHVSMDCRWIMGGYHAVWWSSLRI